MDETRELGKALLALRREQYQLVHVLPGSSMDGLPGSTTLYPEFLGEFPSAFTQVVATAQFSDDLIGELRGGWLGVLGAPLFCFVCHVIGVIAREKVRRITAWRVVAGVTGKWFVFWQRAKCKFIGESMRVNVTRSAITQLAVARLSTVSLPFPTRVIAAIAVNSAPKDLCGYSATLATASAGAKTSMRTTWEHRKRCAAFFARFGKLVGHSGLLNRSVCNAGRCQPSGLIIP